MNQTEKNSSFFGRNARLVWLAWLLCVGITILTLVNLVLDIHSWQADTGWINLAQELVFLLLPIGYALMATLVASRQPRNTIAWLMMTIAVTIVIIQPIDSYLDAFTAVPDPTPRTLIIVWLQNWTWLLFIVPLFLILLLFPDGKPPTPRLRWVPVLAISLVILFALTAAFSATLSPTDYADWKLPNPIGFIPESTSWLVAPILLGLALLVLICPLSLLYRYRRAGAIEREQIKWMLFTSAIFVTIYLPWIVLNDIAPTWLADLVGLLMFSIFYLFPAAIAIAILRYRLWDIDVLIRKSLIYALLTSSLGLVYFGLTTLLELVFTNLTGTKDSTVVIVLSTLAIAFLFSPLQIRIKNSIDRRFYREKLNTQNTLEQFALSLRNEVELEMLSQHLLAVVEDAMKPQQLSLWICRGKGIKQK